MTLDDKSAKRDAMNRASRRETCSQDMQQYLVKRGYSREIANNITLQMVDMNFVNDERYARMWIRAQGLRGKGAIWLQNKLKEKGLMLGLGAVKSILLDAVETTPEDTARRLVERKYPRAFEDSKQLQRAKMMLLRNGYSYSVIHSALSDFTSK